MNTIVLVKQVPDTTEMNIDKETGTLIRKGVPTIINPDDLAGVEAALTLKETYGGSVTAISMGPSQTEGMLEELYARGVDECILVSDRAYAGSDTWATSNILSTAIKSLEYDLVIAGRQAIDGDTAQVGPQIAEFLGIPQVSYVEAIDKIDDDKIFLTKAYETYSQKLSCHLPCLITTLSEMNEPRYMHAKHIFNIDKKSVKHISNEDLKLDEAEVGLKGSPTKVHKTAVKSVQKKTIKLKLSPEEAAQKIIDTIQGKEGARQ
jgi:electron transfer flavoprotein beta subunit